MSSAGLQNSWINSSSSAPTPSSGVFQNVIGYNNPITFDNTSAQPVNGTVIADISFLLPYFANATPPPAFPSLAIKVGNVLCGYSIDKATSAFPATGTFFLYLSVDGSAVDDQTVPIVQTIPLSSVAELVNDIDPTSPSNFVATTTIGVLQTATSLRLMAYYTTPTEPTWSIVFSLGSFGVQPLPTILMTPP
jgi:hypothetical protein